MKICSKCNDCKPNKAFGFKNKEKKTLQAYCRSCNKGYQAKHYIENKENYAAKAKEYKIQYKKKVYSWIKNFVLENPCVDCRIDDFRVIHFDHRDPLEKEFEISAGITANINLEELKEEIKKCDVRCANCHMLRTAKQFNWYNSLAS